jgi:flagellar hook protein FlgE
MPNFTTALSALAAQSTAVDIVGNNLANLNTTGYKASTASFHDLVSASSGTGDPVGMGVGTVQALRQFTQGATQATAGPLDAAIQGDGFFIAREANGNQVYTRAGNFRLDASGNLLTASGQRVQGWTALNGTLNTGGPAGNVLLSSGAVLPAKPTSAFSFDLNLAAGAAKGDSFTSSIEVYDSLGSAHTVTVTYTKQDVNKWDYSISVPDADLKAAFTPVTGSLIFDSNGKLDPSTTAPPKITIKGFANGAGDQDLTFETRNGTNGRITQFGAPSAVSGNAQNGNAVATLLKVGIADGGKIVASYSNGKTSVVGQLALATFRNPESLIAMGDNNFALGAGTSAPVIGEPETGGRGKVLGGSLESSTVDIAREFTNLIVYQRGYQANSKVITTMDEMTQDTVNLKR